ncbi:MAG: GIY-YIG nuclease family protein [Candidatus Wildermuthbacteria bacterium]|nr:GIY-YIG nuclease family protein [Candidatus Wildermuthbacteria bacterium]
MFLYILKSIEHGNYYIGITQDLENRLRKHNRGQVFSTRSRRPWDVIHKEYYNTRSAAFHREKYLKSLKSREALEKIITASSSSPV